MIHKVLVGYTKEGYFIEIPLLLNQKNKLDIIGRKEGALFQRPPLGNKQYKSKDDMGWLLTTKRPVEFTPTKDIIENVLNFDECKRDNLLELRLLLNFDGHRNNELLSSIKMNDDKRIIGLLINSKSIWNVRFGLCFLAPSARDCFIQSCEVEINIKKLLDRFTPINSETRSKLKMLKEVYIRSQEGYYKYWYLDYIKI